MKASDKKRRNTKRWKKGQSCVSNPEANKFRVAAKNRFFNVISGPSNLTEAALAHHNTSSENVDISDDVQSVGGRTSSTWATHWTDCTNITFNKVHRYVTSHSAAHKSVLAVLAAITEVIKSNDGKQSDTEYFAALMTALDNRSNDDETLAAIVYLLSLCLKRVPGAVLRTKFSEASKLLMNILAERMDRGSPSLLRSILKCLAQLLRVQDQVTWNNASTLHVYNTILAFATHAKPKVRKAGSQAVCSVLFASDIMTQPNPPLHHPATNTTAKYCISQIENCGGSGEATVTLHTLGLLQDILHILPKSSLKSTCEMILKLMTLSNVMVTTVCFRCLHKMFKSRPDNKSLPGDLNAQIITALYDYQPGENDHQLMSAWLAVMKEAHSNLALMRSDLFISHSTRYFTVAMNCMKANNADISKVAANCLVSLMKTEMAAQSVNLGKMISISPNTNSAGHKIFQSIENGLSYQFHASWELVLELLTSTFQALGKDSHSIMGKCLHSLADLRDSHKFTYKTALDKAIGAAVRSMGPRVVLAAIPLQISGQGDDYDFPRSWLLPVLHDNIQETELAFFTQYFLPLAAKLHTRGMEYSAEGRSVEAKTYDALQHQIWSLLPPFCTKPTDILQSFKGLAKVLGFAMKDREDIRGDIMSSLRKLILQNADNEEIRTELARFAKNFLPLLFNLFTVSPDDENDVSRMAVLETIKIYVTIADIQLVGSYVDMCLGKLKEEGNSDFKTYALLDLCIGLVQYTDGTRLEALLDYIFINIKNKDRTIQKKSYRILEMLCASQSHECTTFVAANIRELQTHLCKSLSSSKPSAKAPRLRCLYHIFKQLKEENLEFLQTVVPEAVLCTKETAEKARFAAYGLLIQLIRTLYQWNPETPKAAVVQMYFELVLAGLAGQPHVISCTLLALANITHEFKDMISDELLTTLVESCCMLMESNAREIVRSALGFLKELVIRFDEATVGQFLAKIVAALVSMKDSNKHQLRYKAKEIFSRLVRKFGYNIVTSLVPETHHKMIAHIKKMQDRSKRKKEHDSENDSDEETVKVENKPESFEEFLADSDSDLEDDVTKKKKKMNKLKENKSEKGAAWLQESGEALDFLDPSVSHKVLSTKPNQKGTGAKKSGRDDPFKLASDGRMIIQEEQEEEKSEAAPLIDDLDELLDAFEGHGKKSRKRKLTAADEDDEDVTGNKYKAGGGGIHRAVKKLAPGEEYKAKKARGDIKKKGKPDPYAYIPLDATALNKRKRAKVKGQFKNFVRGAQKGAMKGQKLRAKNKR